MLISEPMERIAKELLINEILSNDDITGVLEEEQASN